MAATDLAWVEKLAHAEHNAPQWPPSAYLRAVEAGATPKRIALVAVGTEISPDSGLLRGVFTPGLGFAIVSLVPPESELETIVVDAAARRSGVGRALMAALVAALKSGGMTEVTLEVRASNLPAQAFYLSAGFQETGRRPLYYADPLEDAHVFALKLV